MFIIIVICIHGFSWRGVERGEISPLSPDKKSPSKLGADGTPLRIY